MRGNTASFLPIQGDRGGLFSESLQIMACSPALYKKGDSAGRFYSGLKTGRSLFTNEGSGVESAPLIVHCASYYLPVSAQQGVALHALFLLPPN